MAYGSEYIGRNMSEMLAFYSGQFWPTATALDIQNDDGCTRESKKGESIRDTPNACTILFWLHSWLKSAGCRANSVRKCSVFSKLH